MRITKCDICKKTINRESKSLQLMGGSDDIAYISFELCSACSQPILKILKNKKLIVDDNKKNGGK